MIFSKSWSNAALKITLSLRLNMVTSIFQDNDFVKIINKFLNGLSIEWFYIRYVIGLDLFIFFGSVCYNMF